MAQSFVEGGSRMTLGKRATAEFLGTFWLVLGGCGSAVLAAAFPALGIGFAGVSLAFGLTLLTMAFAIGPISGCHINPAVTVGLVVGKRFPASELVPYVVAQVLGGDRGSGRPLPDRERQGGLRPRRRVRVQRLRRAFARAATRSGGARLRDRDDLHVPGRDPRRDGQARAGRLRRASRSASR